jgi:hypothetical protein
MYQHQHSPLPLEQIEGFPQPLVVLLETLLEKDPGQRFQDPGELLKAIPTITARIEAGRRITRDVGTDREKLFRQPFGPTLPKWALVCTTTPKSGLIWKRSTPIGSALRRRVTPTHQPNTGLRSGSPGP